MNERRSTERLRADAEERLRLTDDLPARIEAVRGTAHDDARTIAVTATVHGALAGLAITADALALGPARLGEEIVRLAAAANRTALVDGLGLLSRVLGDAGTMELARSMGLGDLIDPDAPVVPQVPSADNTDDDYAMTFDFSSLRSDR
ncbi:MAG TPA: hypothetical protein VH333_24465 [Pseudonocardiaceae bacterium]|jgi:hypothetical protein|nr:hypothetical protein [Pseudonocardiaceae bacterium]